MKKNKIDVIDGFGKVKPGKKLTLLLLTEKLLNIQLIISSLQQERVLANYQTYHKMVKSNRIPPSDDIIRATKENDSCWFWCDWS